MIMTTSLISVSYSIGDIGAGTAKLNILFKGEERRLLQDLNKQYFDWSVHTLLLDLYWTDGHSEYKFVNKSQKLGYFR